MALRIEETMNWTDLLKIKSWTPLAAMPTATEPTSIPKVRQVGDNCFVHVQEYNKKMEMNDSNAPFVTKAYWAEGEAGVRRVATAGAAAKVPSPMIRPPAELLSGTNGTYGELRAKIPKVQNKPIGRALYAKTGEFLYQVLSIDRFDYCFLSNEAKDDDRVFAIEVSLVKSS
jgi:hypothetical protein